MSNYEVEELKKDIKYLESELARCKAMLVSAQTDAMVYRGRLDLMECHLKEAKELNVRFLSRIQEFESRDF